MQRIYYMLYYAIGNAAYIFAGHRTWLVMIILSSCQAVTITLFVVFYRKLEKKKKVLYHTVIWEILYHIYFEFQIFEGLNFEHMVRKFHLFEIYFRLKIWQKKRQQLPEDHP